MRGNIQDINDTQGQALAGHVIGEAVRRAGLDGGEIEDVVMGCALQQGSTGFNVARQGAPWAGLPEPVPGTTIGRQCGRGGWQSPRRRTASCAASRRSPSRAGSNRSDLSRNAHSNGFRGRDPKLIAEIPALYMAMLENAEIVAEHYGVSRAAQDEYALQSQQRTAAAQATGYFDAEIMPVTTTMKVTDKASGETSSRAVTLRHDEGNRLQTTLADLQKLTPRSRAASV